MKTSNGKKSADAELIRSLNTVLADAYAMTSLTHLAHWNVEGPNFFSLHKALQEQYEQLFEAADEIAERIRALGAYTLGGLATLARASSVEEFKPPMESDDFVAALIKNHCITIANLTVARDLANDIEDLETQDLMIKRIQAHQKTVWMLKSVLR